MRPLLIIVLLVVFSQSAVAVQIGAPAPPFQLEDGTGARTSLEQHRGAVVIVAFWASWCTSCLDELSGLQQLYTKHRERGLMVIGIQVEGSRSASERIREKLALSFPLLRDAEGNTAAAYGVSGIPASFLVGKDGVIRRRYRGFERSLITRIEADIVGHLKIE